MHWGYGVLHSYFSFYVYQYVWVVMIARYIHDRDEFLMPLVM